MMQFERAIVVWFQERHIKHQRQINAHNKQQQQPQQQQQQQQHQQQQ